LFKFAARPDQKSNVYAEFTEFVSFELLESSELLEPDEEAEKLELPVLVEGI
jgi:hypothetical protein